MSHTFLSFQERNCVLVAVTVDIGDWTCYLQKCSSFT